MVPLDVSPSVPCLDATRGLDGNQVVPSNHSGQLSGSVRGITFPESGQAVNRNAIVLLKGAPRAELGRAWIDLVLGAQGQSVLADAGFGGAP